MKPTDAVFLKVIDHLVSGEEFHLRYDEELDLLATFPQPDPEKLSSYYKSEDYISHTDSKKSFFEKIYGAVKNITIASKVSLIKKENKEPGKLLDVGAGTGDFLLAAKEKNWQVYGVEPNAQALNLAQEKGLELETDFSDIEESGIDVITLWHVLEHIPGLENFPKRLFEKLKPGGTLLIAVPNYKSFDAAYYKNYWAAYDVPRHLWHFSKTSIKRIFEKEGFHLKEVRPMFFDSFYVSLLSEKYKSGKTNWMKAFYIGLRSVFYGMSKKEYSSHIYVLKKEQISN